MRQPEIYDALCQSRGHTWDISHYLHVGRSLEPRSILEVGAGTGRILIPMLREGLDVYGLEVNSEMLEAARKKAVAMKLDQADINRRLLCGDIFTSSLDQRFGGVLASYNFLSLIPPCKIDHFLGRVEKLLGQGGVLAFDIVVADQLPWGKGSNTWEEEIVLSIRGREAHYVACGSFSPSTRIHIIQERVDFLNGVIHEERLELYQWKPAMLEECMWDAGWIVDQARLDETGKPFSSASRVFAGRASLAHST